MVVAGFPRLYSRHEPVGSLCIARARDLAARKLRRRRRGEQHPGPAATPAATQQHRLSRRGPVLVGTLGATRDRGRSHFGHPCPGHGGRHGVELHRDRGPHDGAATGQRRPARFVLLRGLHARRRRTCNASGHLLLQRRPRFGHRLAAPGLVRAQAPRHRRTQHVGPPSRFPWSTTPSRCWTSPTSCSSTPSARVSRRRSRPTPTRPSGAWTSTPRCSATSSCAIVAKTNRAGSPKFLYGESYGGPRTAVLADLLEAAGVHLAGVVLQSPALNYNSNCGISSRW